ncbi:MAG: 3-methyl-2-oxobutanoate hydroxymethyltransferase [Ignavibacteria bacterium]|jgi:3-methyl-2-oxobutanoate hydroxymethyltransferase|nr:3-methyl-2-oxobutanoate hydroxymethyltransferase [Ignavibacteria bacterium]MCU7504125.1 3-methyl-2-oxobutanoate hydroxymethyltransferase [Ignavibacteria bacterium]MCU7516425.1 3-methyl-2-oxobutanoate hydroxymethyltransferase [Ignavibacteria bacterium]
MSTYTDFRKITTKSLFLSKQKGTKIAALTAYDFITAKLLDQAGIDLILVGDSLSNVFQGNETTLPVTMDEMIYHTKAVSKGVERAMVVVDMPFMSYQTNLDEAFRNAGRIMKETPAGGVKLEGGERVAETVRKITEAGIPVMGHIGLTPQSIHQFGSYKARGKDEEEARQLIKDAKILEESGAFSVVLEKIPAELAKEITESISIPTIGIGAGVFCDGQILVTPDMLGLNVDFNPRFVRHYANLAGDMVEAVKNYVKDVKEKGFPSGKESY